MDSAKPTQPSRFLPLTNMAFHVLLALADGPSHGYAIGKEMQVRSRGKLKPTTGGLYQVLKRLAERGLIELDRSGGGNRRDSRRQYFRLTLLGRRVAAAEAQRLEALVALATEKELYPESL